MRGIFSEIGNRRVLFATVFGLQALTCMLPFVTLFRFSPDLMESALADAAKYFSPWTLMLWAWFAATGLIGAGGYWSSEAGARFSLEATRYSSFGHWLGRKLGAVVAMSVLAYGAVPAVFLFATYPGQLSSAMLASLLLASWGLHLALALVAASMLGIGMRYAFAGVLTYHAGNVILEAMGRPNAISFFLIGAEGSPATLLVSVAGAAGVLAIMHRLCNPTALSTRGDEFL